MTLEIPNFIIIGAPKSGTTALYHYLKQHPEVFMSAVKEPRFFAYLAAKERGEPKNTAYYAIRTEEAYRGLFAGAAEKAVGEASVAYLEIPGTARHMKRYVPHARLIALLRNPVERAYSQYLMNVRAGKEKRSFDGAIAEGKYLSGGFYFNNLSDYVHRFGAEQLGLYLYEDLRDHPLALMQEIFRFLDVDDAFVPDLTMKHNVGGAPKNQVFNAVLTRKRFNQWIKRRAPAWVVRLGLALKRLNYKPAPMPEHARRRLIEIYEADIVALEKLINRDLRHWLADEERVPA